MDKKRAFVILQQKFEEIPNLKKLSYDNRDFKLWRSDVMNVIKAAFDDNDYYEFYYADHGKFKDEELVGLFPDNFKQESYIENITNLETALLSIINKYKLIGIEGSSNAILPESVIPELRLKAFIAHGGETPALDKLKSFLSALGVDPIVVEEQPSRGRSVGENVDYYARQCDCAVILATKGDIDGKTGSFIPRGNVLIEIGKAQELFKDRIVYLIQAGVNIPTDISEKVRGRFTTSCMDDAFIKVANELKEFGIIKVIKP
jgi:hypothetical protein